MTDPMDVEIRPVLNSEVDTLRQIARETFDVAFRALNTEATMNQYMEEAFHREKLSAELANPGSRFYFMVVDGEMAGYLKLNDTNAQTDIHDPNSLEVERIYVKKTHQGKRLGRRFIAHALHIAGEMGKQYVWLGVWEKNAEAIAFYKNVGFKEAGRHTFRMGDEHQTDLIMKQAVPERSQKRSVMR